MCTVKQKWNSVILLPSLSGLISGYPYRYKKYRCFLRYIVPLLLLIFTLLASGCKNYNNKKRNIEVPESKPFQIVSLSPAITDILIDMGLESNIIGRDNWESQLRPTIPRVGDLTNLDVESLIILDPTDIILQAGNQGIPSALQNLATKYRWNVVNVQIDHLKDIENTILNLPEKLSIKNTDPEQYNILKEEAKSLISRAKSAIIPLPEEITNISGKILFIHHVNTISIFGPGSYLCDILEALGGQNAIQNGPPWQQLDAELLIQIDPWALIIVNSGPVANKSRDISANYRDILGPLSKLPLQAIRNKRVIQLSHPQILLPGSSMMIEVPPVLRNTLITLSGEIPQQAILKETTDLTDLDESEPTQ